MSELHNEKLRALAKRSNCELMSPEDSFVQGFIMGRNYEAEINSNLHNKILSELRSAEAIKFSDNNWWDNRIKELEKENFDLKCKYVYESENGE